MNVSVIVPTCNGSTKISVLLEALLKQTESDFELVVIDDGSTDNTLDVVKRYEGKFSNLKVISQTNRGRSIVRNRGAKEASGDTLIFYDDDMEPVPDSVEQHKRFHERHVGILGGNQVEVESEEKSDIQNYKASLTRRWIKKYREGLNLLDQGNLFFTAANCSMTREVFAQLNGFDERLTDAEDFYFAVCAGKKGIPVYFDKANVAVHHDYISARSYALRLRQYRHSHKRLEALDPGLNSVQHTTPSYKRNVYKIFASPFWIQAIDRNRLTFLPRVIRYKLYDLVFQAVSVEYPDVKL